MPAPAYPVPPAIAPLQLYRHILREVSYLPPAFRLRIQKEVRRRFRLSKDDKERDPATDHRKGRQFLRTLRGANSGDLKTMEGLIARGFGRVGFRKAEIMTEFSQPTVLKDSAALEKFVHEARSRSLEQATKTQLPRPAVSPSPQEDQPLPKTAGQEKKGRRSSFYEQWDREKLMILLKSQMDRQDATKKSIGWQGRNIKSVNENQFIPDTNIWGKPPHWKVVQTKKAHFWRRAANKMMVPLEPDEWALLGRLSQGAQETSPLMTPKRRRPARPLAEQGDGAAPLPPSWHKYATRQANWIETPKKPRHQRRTGERDLGPYAFHARVREPSSRWFRRAYTRAWQLSPKAKQDPQTLQWSFVWGDRRHVIPVASAQQMAFIGDGANKANTPEQSGTG